MAAYGHNQTFEVQMHCLDQTEDTNLIRLYYYAYADRQICGAVNESITYRESACFSIFNSTDRWVRLITVSVSLYHQQEE